MSALVGLFNLLPSWLWAGLVAASVLHGCWVGHQRDNARNMLHDVQARVAKEESARARVALTANANFRKFEHQQAASAMELEDANQKRKAAAVVADDRARAADQRLRDTIGQLDAAARSRPVSGAGVCATELAKSRREAEGARALLGSCTAEYRAVGAAAALDGIDLDTALGYVDLVQTTAPSP